MPKLFDRIIEDERLLDELLVDPPVRPKQRFIRRNVPTNVVHDQAYFGKAFLDSLDRLRDSRAKRSATSPVKQCSVVPGCNVFSCLHEITGCRLLGCDGTCQRCKDWKLRDARR